MRRISLLVLAAMLAATSALAQGSVSVAPSEPAYRDVDRLVADGLVDGVIVGQRPYSRNEFVRIARAAQRALAGRGDDARSAASRLAVRRLLGAFDSTTARPLDQIRLGVLHSGEPARAILPNGLGGTEADITPLTDGRQGRRFIPGTTLALETDSWARIGSSLTLDVRPRLSAARATGGGTSARGEILSASARLVRRNVALTAGREYSYWGNAPAGGLLFSDNAPALDLVRVASEHPFLLPWIARRLGPAAAALQIADLGPSVQSSHSRLVSYKLSVQPAPSLEIGATFANNFGGAGAKGTGLKERLFDLMPFVDIFRHHADSTDVVSDKLLGMDARWRAGALGGATLFSELMLEDFDVHRLRSVFTEDAAWIVGASVPALFLPSLSAQVSWHATGIRFYEHHLVQNGIASRRFLLGDDLGRDANGVYVSARLEPRSGLALTLDGATELRRDDRYEGAYVKPGAQQLVFTRTAVGTHERRHRLVLGAELRSPDGRGGVMLRAGGESVGTTTPAGLAGTTRHGVVEASFTAYP